MFLDIGDDGRSWFIEYLAFVYADIFGGFEQRSLFFDLLWRYHCVYC